MLFDWIALGIFAVFVAIGAWRGTLASGSGLASLALGYVAAAICAGQYGPALSERFGVPSIFGPVVAGTLGFGVAYTLCGLLALGLRTWDRRRRGDDPRSGLDRFGGALFGALRGGMIVLLLSILATWLDAARDLGVIDGLGGLPDTSESRVGRAAGDLLERAVESAASDGEGETDPAARVMARIAARPGTSLESMQVLVDDERVQAVQGDRFFWVLVENGAGERAINQASFYGIVHDESMRARFADLGLVSEDAATDPEAFRLAMAGMLSQLGPKLKGLRDDPEIQELARDPEIVALLESGDTFALMTHPDIQRVVSRVAASK